MEKLTENEQQRQNQAWLSDRSGTKISHKFVETATYTKTQTWRTVAIAHSLPVVVVGRQDENSGDSRGRHQEWRVCEMQEGVSVSGL